jgi:hypothetical protein
MKHYLPTKQQNKIWILVLLTFIFTHSALVNVQAQISLTEESLPSKGVEIISLQKENYYSFETTPMTNVGSEDVFIIQGSNQKIALAHAEHLIVEQLRYELIIRRVLI